MRKPVRNYLRILNEFINIESPFDLEILNTIIYNEIGYPFISLHTHTKAKFNIVISAGVHGNEGIAVKVLLRFITEFNKDLLNYYNFLIFPIMNPFAYRFGGRKNGNKQYVNDGFIKGKEDAATPETKLIKEALPNKIDLFIDIHSDESKSGFYLYERRRPNIESLAQKGLAILKTNKIPILEANTVYREKCVDGIIIQPERDGSIDNAMFNKGAIFSLCIEIPGKMSEDSQIIGGLLLLNEILLKFKGVNK